MNLPPRLAFTPGEPAGIGIDLAIQLAQQDLAYEIVCFTDQKLLEARAKKLKLKIHIENFDIQNPRQANKKKQIKLIPIPLAEPVEAKILNVKNAYFVLESIKQASQHCLKQTMDALITGPIHKGIINQAGITFTGHTEFLQSLSNVHKVVMMLAHTKMRVALVTTHLPLSKVPDAITKNEIIQTLTILNQALISQFKIKKPCILVAGLNPHAGESGHMGDEEIKVIQPALTYCSQNLNINTIGPLPADTLFTEKYLSQADAVLAMYHDQGLPVLKYSGFGQAVNITLGLPFVRTSVDHGTALDLAGTGQASGSSLQAAITQAIEMIQPGS